MTNRHLNILNFKLAAFARNFPWPVIRLCRRFPPLKTNRSSRICVMVMATPKSMLDAIWAAYTFVFWHGRDFDLRIIVDGRASPRSRAILKAILPEAEVISGEGLQPDVAAFAHLSEFSQKSRFGRKLLYVSVLNQLKPLIYFDSDILFFNKGLEVETWSQNPNAYLGFVCDYSSANTYRNKNLALNQLLGASPPSGFNSGFMLLPKDFIAMTQMNEALAAARKYDAGKPVHGYHEGRLFYAGGEYFIDQVLFGHFAGKFPSVQLNKELYDHSGAGFYVLGKDDTGYEKIVMHHFTGNFDTACT